VNQTMAARGISLRPYREKDETEVIGLLKTALGEGPTDNRTQEFFEWKHLNNPFGRSYLLVAECDGRIVGLRAFMRWSFVADDQIVAAVRAVDTATHPDFRGLGIFSTLTLAALGDLAEEADFVFNTPNDKSRPGYLKMGWRAVGNLPVRLRVQRPVRFAVGLRSLRTSSGPVRSRPSVDALPAADALADVAGLGELVRSSSRQTGRLSTAHTSASLMWRYAKAPALDYRVVGDRQRGFAIFRVRPRGALWETTVAEILIPDANPARAKELLLEVGRAARVDHVTCMIPEGSAALTGSRRARFVRSPIGMTLTARPLRSSPIDPLEKRSWALTLGDVEVF